MSAATLAFVIVALAVLLSLGFGLISLVAGRAVLYATEKWAVAYLLGTGAGAFLWFALSSIYSSVSPKVAITAIALGVSVAGTRTRRTRGAIGAGLSAEAARAAKAGASAVLTVVLLLECAVLFAAALHTPLGWDALFNFEIKARIAMENATPGRLPLAYLSDSSRNWSHPQYPLVVPFAELWIYSWLGRVDQSAIKVLFPLFYFSLIAIVCAAVRRMAGRVPGLACGILLGALPPLALQPGAISGYADVPLAAAFAGAVALAMLAFATGNREALWIAAGLSAVAAWTKAEGLALSMALGGSAFFARWVTGSSGARISPKDLSSLCWVPLLAVAPWVAVQQVYGQASSDFQHISLTTTAENLHRVPDILSLFARELVRPGHWGFIWPAFGISIVATVAARRATDVDWLMAGAIAIPLFAYALVFIYSAWPSVSEHIGWSLSRLLVSLAPIALMFAVKQIWPSREAETWA